jgi:hypothetical protein
MSPSFHFSAHSQFVPPTRRLYNQYLELQFCISVTLAIVERRVVYNPDRKCNMRFRLVLSEPLDYRKDA